MISYGEAIRHVEQFSHLGNIVACDDKNEIRDRYITEIFYRPDEYIGTYDNFR